jgi:predicted GNAT family N-acyltransferase
VLDLTFSTGRASQTRVTKASTIKLVEVGNESAMRLAWAIRRLVFIDEQHVPEQIEMDAEDAAAFHIIAMDGDVAVGCGRMVMHLGEVKIGRMAVLRERRGEGIGRLILEYLMNAARERGFRRAILHAQLTAEGFYLKQGYLPRGEVFEEAGIAHRLMELEL